MASRRGGRTLRGPVVALAGAVAALIGVESYLRLFAPQPLAFSRSDPSGLTLHIPNATIRHTRREFDHWIHFNSLGLRGRETSERKPPGVHRILVLGDSYAEAAQVTLEESFASRVESALAARHPERRWEVVNGGVSGYATADEIRFFELLGRRLEPDVVILAFCVGNDFIANLRSKLFRWRDGKLEEIPQTPPSTTELAAARVKEFAASRFHTVQFLRDRLRELRGRKRRDRLVAPRVRPDGSTVGFSPAAEEITAALLDRLRESVASANARFLLVAIPQRAQLEPRKGVEPTSGSADSPPPQRWLAAYARERGVVFIDLLAPLRRAHLVGRVYNRIDGHLNARGHAVAAAEILRALDERPEILSVGATVVLESVGS